MKKILLSASLFLSFTYAESMPIDKLTERCFEGKAYSCANAAINYYSKEDYESAYSLFTKGCELDDERSCFQKAQMEYKGKGNVKQDEEKALKSFEELCKKDSFESCLFLGRDAEQKNKSQDAKRYFYRACSIGIDEGCKKSKNLK